jgi:hypothetical protein
MGAVTVLLALVMFLASASRASAATGPPVITVQPQDAIVLAGSSVTFTAGATGAYGGVDFRSDDGGVTWRELGGGSCGGPCSDNFMVGFTMGTVSLSDNGALFRFRFANPSGSVGTRWAKLTVCATWPCHPTVVPGVGSVLEGNSGTTVLQVPVTLSNATSQTVTVPWTTEYVPGAPGNQADPATDYTPASGTVTFAPGQTSATVPISVNGDTLVEPDEYLIVSFHDPTNAVMGGFWGLGFGTIVNDDHITVQPGLGTVAAPTTGTADLAVPVTLDQPSAQTVTVEWNTEYVPGAPDSPSGPQAPVSDYTPSSGTVTFAPGDTSADVHIPVTADSLTPGEYVMVSFHNATNAVVGGFWGLGFGTITPSS